MPKAVSTKGTILTNCVCLQKKCKHLPSQAISHPLLSERALDKLNLSYMSHFALCRVSSHILSHPHTYLTHPHSHTYLTHHHIPSHTHLTPPPPPHTHLNHGFCSNHTIVTVLLVRPLLPFSKPLHCQRHMLPVPSHNSIKHFQDGFCRFCSLP